MTSSFILIRRCEHCGHNHECHPANLTGVYVNTGKTESMRSPQYYMGDLSRKAFTRYMLHGGAKRPMDAGGNGKHKGGSIPISQKPSLEDRHVVDATPPQPLKADSSSSQVEEQTSDPNEVPAELLSMELAREFKQNEYQDVSTYGSGGPKREPQPEPEPEPEQIVEEASPPSLEDGPADIPPAVESPSDPEPKRKTKTVKKEKAKRKYNDYSKWKFDNQPEA